MNTHCCCRCCRCPCRGCPPVHTPCSSPPRPRTGRWVAGTAGEGVSEQLAAGACQGAQHERRPHQPREQLDRRVHALHDLVGPQDGARHLGAAAHGRQGRNAGPQAGWQVVVRPPGEREAQADGILGEQSDGGLLPVLQSGTEKQRRRRRTVSVRGERPASEGKRRRLCHVWQPQQRTIMSMAVSRPPPKAAR